MPLSLCWLTVAGAHPFEHIEAAGASGFDAVGLRLVPPTPQEALLPIVGDEPLIREILARLEAAGLAVMDIESVWIGPELDVGGLLPTLELGARLGATGLVTMGIDPDEPRLAQSYARLSEAAGRFGLHVGIEFAAYTAVKSLEAAQRLAERCGQPNCHVLVDSLHFARSGGVPADVARMDPKWLQPYCQLSDARGPRPADGALRDEARGGRVLVGEGELPLAALLEALPPGFPVGVETPTRELAGRPVMERARASGAAARRFLQARGALR